MSISLPWHVSCRAGGLLCTVVYCEAHYRCTACSDWGRDRGRKTWGTTTAVSQGCVALVITKPLRDTSSRWLTPLTPTHSPWTPPLSPSPLTLPPLPCCLPPFLSSLSLSDRTPFPKLQSLHSAFSYVWFHRHVQSYFSWYATSPQPPLLKLKIYYIHGDRNFCAEGLCYRCFFFFFNESAVKIKLECIYRIYRNKELNKKRF